MWLCSKRRMALIAVLAVIGATRVFGQCLERQKLAAFDQAADDYFGGCVSVSGDTAVVGASGDDCAAGDWCGAAYVYRFTGVRWVGEQKLVASDASAGDRFGFSVAASGAAIAVGAWGDDGAEGVACGSAYVFRFDGATWVEEQKLTASDAHEGDNFGRSISISGDVIVVGAYQSDCEAGEDCGSAYVFRFDGMEWAEEQKLVASDADAGDLFGWSVSVSEDTAVVGAVWADCPLGENCGSTHVYRFRGAGWVEEQELRLSSLGPFALAGSAVSVSQDTVVVGAAGTNCLWGSVCGAAAVFPFNGTRWGPGLFVHASQPTPSDRFGWSASVNDDTFVVGLPGRPCTAGRYCGSAQVHHFDGVRWVRLPELTTADAAPNDDFGGSVSVSRDTVLVGAVGVDCADGDSCGAAYFYWCGIVAGLEIKPGGCRDPVNPKSRGVVPVALVGDLDFDVAAVVPESLMLARADGVGESVPPHLGRPGPGIRIVDLATVHSGEPCECHEAGGDGIDDLSLKFSTAEMNRAFDLESFLPGATVELVLRGSLEDGTRFEAVDCITMPGLGRPAVEPKWERR